MADDQEGAVEPAVLAPESVVPEAKAEEPAALVAEEAIPKSQHEAELARLRAERDEARKQVSGVQKAEARARAELEQLRQQSLQAAIAQLPEDQQEVAKLQLRARVAEMQNELLSAGETALFFSEKYGVPIAELRALLSPEAVLKGEVTPQVLEAKAQALKAAKEQPNYEATQKEIAELKRELERLKEAKAEPKVDSGLSVGSGGYDAARWRNTGNVEEALRAKRQAGLL